ncbi:MAG: 50S ribosomal protein L21 [Candidatus Babeliales bacterium]
MTTKAVTTTEYTATPAPHGVSLEKYAIIQTGGKQYIVVEGKTIGIEKLEGNPGDTVEFTEILLRSAGEKAEVGQPFVVGSVKASIVKHMQGPKVTIFKFKRRKKSRVKKGHRQPVTVVRIEQI